MNTTAILEALEAKRDRLTTAIEALQPRRSGRRRSAGKAGKRRHMSAAARRRISLAQKRRWVERKKKS